MILIEQTTGTVPAGIRTLVHDAGLPLDGLGEVPTTLFMARDDGDLVGCAALERHASHGLLRSLVVAHGRRGEGIGSRLVEAVEGAAREQGLDGLYLLTDTAAPFFAERGFRVIARDAAPAAVQASIEWSEACGDTAVPMVQPGG